MNLETIVENLGARVAKQRDELEPRIMRLAPDETARSQYPAPTEVPGDEDRLGDRRGRGT